MNKYINIILISVFGILSINLNMGYTFYIPFVCYYSLKNIKNLVLIIPFSICSLYYFNYHYYFYLSIFFILLIIINIIFKKNKYIFTIFFSIIYNSIYILIYKDLVLNSNKIYLNIMSLIICPLLLCFLIYNNYTSKDLNKKIRSISYNEILLGLIVSLSTINFSIKYIPLSFILSIYFAMYYSSNKYNLGGMLYCLLATLMIKHFSNIDYSIFVLATFFIYQFKPLLNSIIYILILIYVYIFYNSFMPYNIYICLGVITILFEILRTYIIPNNDETQIINDIYERSIKQIDSEIEIFSLFLDKIANNITNNEYNDDLGNSIIKLSNAICLKCDKRTDCYKINKGKLYYYFKDCIYGNQNSFICEHNEAMRRYGRSLGNSLINKKAYLSDTLYPIITGVTNILKRYSIDHNINIELDHKKLYEIKFGLQNYGYKVCYYEIIKNFKNDFLIEIGLIGVIFSDEKENIENVISHYMGNLTAIFLKKAKGNKIYVNVVPKTKFDVIYGYGSMSKIGNNICGDNYLVKNITNNKIIAIICDGMGKGLNANIISSRTLKLLDEITNANLTSETSLQILNTLYYIQDYQENYTTLDYVEIDKYSGEMTLYKAGAAFTYIIHSDGSIERIENDNLPFGLSEIILSKKIKINDEDLILLASDGIFDNIINTNDFEEYIKTIRDLEPQKISYELLNYARHTDLIAKDDMSVIALKIRSI